MEVQMLSSAELGARQWTSDGPAFVLPFIDPAQARRAATLMSARAGVSKGLLICVHDDAREGFISITNRTFRQSRSPYFGYVAQDTFAGRYWLRNALSVFNTLTTRLVAFNDGKWFGALASYGLARRTWAEQNYGGDFFHSGYKRHYADAELSLLAAEVKGLGYASDAVLIEVDWDKDGRSVEHDDRELFLKRSADGFDGKVQTEALRRRFG